MPEREVLYALGCPFRAHLGRGNPPDLFGVRPEEALVQTAAEVRGHPVLERLDRATAPHCGSEERERAANGLDQPELPNDVPRLEGVIEVLPAVVDAGQPRACQQLVAEDGIPQTGDRGQLREEPVAAEVEAIAVELDGLRDPADEAVGLEHRRRDAALREHV